MPDATAHGFRPLSLPHEKECPVQEDIEEFNQEAFCRRFDESLADWDGIETGVLEAASAFAECLNAYQSKQPSKKLRNFLANEFNGMAEKTKRLHSEKEQNGFK